MHSRNRMETRSDSLPCGGLMRKHGSQGNCCMRCSHPLLRNNFLTTNNLKVAFFWWTLLSIDISLGGQYRYWVWFHKGKLPLPTQYLFCSPWTSRWSAVSKSYTQRCKVLFTSCFNVTEEMSLTLKEWENYEGTFQYLPLHQSHLQNTGRRTLNSACGKLARICHWMWL